MESRISATEAVRDFPEILKRIRDNGEEFVVERDGQPICRIVPAGPAPVTLSDFFRILREAPKPDPGYWDDLEDILKNQPPLPESPWEAVAKDWEVATHDVRSFPRIPGLRLARW